MLSRAQEVRVREVLGDHPPGTIRTFCLEHLAAAARVPTEHAADLAAFVRLLRSRGECQTHDGGFCDAEAHHTDTLLVWKPLDRAAAQGYFASPGLPGPGQRRTT